ncbi:hypothetical protein [Massilia sp. SYSU DXS3249]
MRPLVACMLCLALGATRAEPAPEPPAAPRPAALDEVPTAALPLRARLDRDAIRAAIADLPAEQDPNPRRRAADTLGAAPYQEFSQDFARARLPVCLHADGLRNQPTFFLSGWIALPFVAVAKLRGVCR